MWVRASEKVSWVGVGQQAWWVKQKRKEASWVGMGWRRGSAAWGLGRLGSSTKWVNLWVGDVKLQWAGDVELRVELAAVRQRGESLRV